MVIRSGFDMIIYLMGELLRSYSLKGTVQPAIQGSVSYVRSTCDL